MEDSRSFFEERFDEALVVCIFSELEATSTRPIQDYLALSLTCKLFYRVVQPFLYRRISWRLNGKMADQEYGSKRFFPLLSNTARPDCAAMVQNFSIWKGFYNNQRFLHKESPDFAAQMGIAKRFLLEAGIHQDWATMHPDFEAFGALLLTRFTKLKELDIHTWDFSDGDRLSSRMRTSGIYPEVLEPIIFPRGKLPRTVSILEYLEVVRIHIDNDSSPVNRNNSIHQALISFDTVSRFFYLPNMNTIELERVWAHRNTAWPIGVPNATKLKTLILRDCQFNANQVRLILQAPESLEEFKCHIAMDANFAPGWFDMENLKQSLLPMKSSLRHLDFNLDLYTSAAIDIGNPGSWGVGGSLGSLVEFTNLSYLSIPWPALLGWRVESSAELEEVLPSSLRFLELTNSMEFWYGYEWDDLEAGHDRPRWYTMTTKVTKYMLSRPPSLGNICVTFQSEWEGDGADEVQEILVSTGRTVNIEVEVTIKTG